MLGSGKYSKPLLALYPCAGAQGGGSLNKLSADVNIITSTAIIPIIFFLLFIFISSSKEITNLSNNFKYPFFLSLQLFRLIKLLFGLNRIIFFYSITLRECLQRLVRLILMISFVFLILNSGKFRLFQL